MKPQNETDGKTSAWSLHRDDSGYFLTTVTRLTASEAAKIVEQHSGCWSSKDEEAKRLLIKEHHEEEARVGLL